MDKKKEKFIDDYVKMLNECTDLSKKASLINKECKEKAGLLSMYLVKNLKILLSLSSDDMSEYMSMVDDEQQELPFDEPKPKKKDITSEQALLLLKMRNDCYKA